MTPPDKLVQAAAEAIGRNRGDDPALWYNTCRIALAASFAALPGCEEALAVVEARTYIRNEAECILAALAQDFGEPA